jgi:hypothetical protein
VIHDNLAILFTPPDSTTFAITDAAVTDVGSPDSKGFIMLPTDTRDLWAAIKNTGNQTASNIDICGYVMDTLGTVYFADTVNIALLDPGLVDTASFAPGWTPPSEGTYLVKARIELIGDGVSSNDSLMAEILVMSYPGEFTWVDSTLEGGYAWNGPGSGWANMFTPPQYPCLVQSVSAGINSCLAPPKDIKVMLMDDDTPDGSPGTILAETTFSVTDTAGGWFTFNLHPDRYFVFQDGSFFTGYIQLWGTGSQGDPFIGVDFNHPRSSQAWEFTGSWAPSRNIDSMDYALTAYVGDAPGPTLIQAYASDGPTQGPGIDDDDYVVLNFNTETNIPPLDETNIDAVLPLSAGHTWLSGGGALNSAVWSADSMQLVVYLVTTGGAPTVAVGDTVYPDSLTITDRWGIPCESPRVIEGSFAVGVEESPLRRDRLVNALRAVNPNPFSATARVVFEIADRTHARVCVHDVSGRVVATLVDHVREPGVYSSTWKGTDDIGNELGSGVYFVRMTAGSYSGTIKVGLLR